MSTGFYASHLSHVCIPFSISKLHLIPNTFYLTILYMIKNMMLIFLCGCHIKNDSKNQRPFPIKMHTYLPFIRVANFK